MQLGQARPTNSVKYQNISTNRIIDDLISNINNRSYPNYKMKNAHIKALVNIKNDLRRLENENDSN
ncbi:hypothetical protein HZY83_07445 [Gemella sp. GH3]|uniref:hypothetical protein n=1 Tax=unclassified Gemella TaxID=2624949 RepID=UPI0015CFF92E|nr:MULTISPECIES: hypothetical protein [unclassified Gemella]MBF0714508.1 hypothetical protein [Gemella sp. GH3.1]NYS51460.1 hypothetical protein [Gemella sp. GH3]